MLSALEEREDYWGLEFIKKKSLYPHILLPYLKNSGKFKLL